MSDNKKYDKGSTFMIKPIDIDVKTRRPSFQIGSVTKYNFMVSSELKDGTIAVFEYACLTQNPWNDFVRNAWQWVKCTQPSDIACTIEPCDPPGEQKSAEQMARELVGAPSNKPYFDDPSMNPKPVDVRGSAWVFIYAWAKDVVTQEMRSGITIDNPIFRISQYADRMYEDMMGRIKKG
jgi:hypothetical protein